MHAAVLYGNNLEPYVLAFTHDVGKVNQASAWENVPLQEKCFGIVPNALWSNNSSIQKEPALGEQGMNFSQIHGQLLPDVLEHADRGDLVVRALQISIMPKLDRDAVLKAARTDELLRECQLLAAKSAAMRNYAVVFRSPEDQTAPARPDIKESLPGFELQRAADSVKLFGLRIIEGHPRSAEMSLRILHSRVKK